MSTYRHYVRAGSEIQLKEAPLPTALGAGQVLMRVRAVSLNFRDVAMLTGRYPKGYEEQGIPCSDAAGEVVKVGEDVVGFKVGDRVSPNFGLNNLTGDEEPEVKMANDLGGDAHGVLSEYRVFDEKVLVKVPDHLSWEEAATLTCAGVTAWNALVMPSTIDSGKTALLQGTGGVSMFALMLCIAGGLKPIITSSSDEKLAAAKALAPELVQTINYKTHPNWSKEALRLTGGRGVDIVLENGGPATVGESLASLRTCGTVSLVGFLSGFGMQEQPGIAAAVLVKPATMRGIKVGSKKDYEQLNAFLEQRKVDLKPIVDRKVFGFENAPEAFKHLDSGRHSGKIVVTVP